MSLIGRTIEHFEIESQLGLGGMGTVYLARDVALDRPVAMKVMHPQFAQQPNFRERFLREARSAASLDHASIIKMIEFGQADEFLFMVTEFVPNGSLGNYIGQLHESGKALPLSESMLLIAQVAEALGYAHRRDIIHRDIKPDNVLIKELDKPDRPGDISLRAIVMDFGLAKLLTGDDMTRTGTFMGTLAYMAPEQALAKNVDGRADLYSLGVILYQLVTGKLPLEISSPTEAVMKHLQEVAPPPRDVHSGVPEAVSKLIEKALAKDVDERYQDGDALAADLRAVAGSLTWAEMTAYAPPEDTVSLVTQVKSKPPTELPSRKSTPPIAAVQQTIVDPDATKQPPKQAAFAGTIVDPDALKEAPVDVAPMAGGTIVDTDAPKPTDLAAYAGTIVDPDGVKKALSKVEPLEPAPAGGTIIDTGAKPPVDKAFAGTIVDPDGAQVEAQQAAIRAAQEAAQKAEQLAAQKAADAAAEKAALEAMVDDGPGIAPTDGLVMGPDDVAERVGASASFAGTVIEGADEITAEQGVESAEIIPPMPDLIEAPPEITVEPEVEPAVDSFLQSAVSQPEPPEIVEPPKPTVDPFLQSAVSEPEPEPVVEPTVYEEASVAAPEKPAMAEPIEILQTVVDPAAVKPAESEPPIEQPIEFTLSDRQGPDSDFEETEPVLPLQSYVEATPKVEPEPEPPKPAETVFEEPPVPNYGQTIMEDAPLPPSQYTEITPQAKLQPLDAPQSGTLTPLGGQTAAGPPAQQASVALTINPNHIRVDPGQIGQAQVNLFNQGYTVEHFNLKVISETAAGWSELAQETVQLMPGQQGVVTVAFRVPKDASARAGWHDYDVVATSAETGQEAGRADGRINVMAFEQFSVKLQPQKVRHGRNAKLVINNEGNGAARFNISPRDPAGMITFDVPSGPFEIAAGANEMVPMKLRGQERRFMGRTERFPFEVRVNSTAGVRQTQRGELRVPPRVSTLGCVFTLLFGLLAAAFGAVTIVNPCDLPEQLAPVAALTGGCPVVTREPPTPQPDGAVVIEAETPTPEAEAESLEPGVMGLSVNGTAIEVVRFGSGPKSVVLVGGIHGGYAPASVSVMRDAIGYFGTTPDAVPENVSLFIIDNFNPDSPPAVKQLAGRLNANGVDLNRNFDCLWTANARVLNRDVPGSGGSGPMSEPESAAFATFVEDIQPSAVIVLGASAPNGRVTAGLCEGPTAVSAVLATTFGAATGYQTFDNTGASGTNITGDVTDWLDKRGIPAVFVLLKDHENGDWPSVKVGLEAVIQGQ